MRIRYLKQAWLVLVLAVLFAAVLGGVQIALGAKVSENQRNETYDQIPLLVPGARKDKTIEQTVDQMQGYSAFDSAGEQIGWVVRAGAQGYADRIELLIGLDVACQKITGLYVLEQKETPGLGNHITDTHWREQFTGQSAARPLGITRQSPVGEGEILAITGATISSRTVCEIVNETVRRFRRAIAETASED